ncbi:MAG TPA: sulfite exporter TauE/SafE family protein [Solirubrobacteraceae bacterium]|nr:sulfite exporter TauE/SafE family protein [Solirubrobacteraceae bacterium]
MIAAIGIGVAAGIIAGLLGVGGGIIFVPALVLVLGFQQVNAEATSLLAILPVAVVGTWRQRRYGNVRLRDGLVIGLLAAGGTVGGVAVANALPQRALEIGFAGLALVIAVQLLRRGLGPEANRSD